MSLTHVSGAIASVQSTLPVPLPSFIKIRDNVTEKKQFKQKLRDDGQRDNRNWLTQSTNHFH